MGLNLLRFGIVEVGAEADERRNTDTGKDVSVEGWIDEARL